MHIRKHLSLENAFKEARREKNANQRQIRFIGCQINMFLHTYKGGKNKQTEKISRCQKRNEKYIPSALLISYSFVYSRRFSFGFLLTAKRFLWIQ